MFDEMMDMPDATLSIGVNRTATAQDRDGMGATISPQAFAALQEQMGAWVGTRVMRYEQQTGLMPQQITVTITVDVHA